MKKTVLFLIASLFILSCSKNDDDITPQTEESEKFILDSQEGSWFIMTGPNGKKDTLKGQFVNYSGGQLMEQSFYRILMVATSKGSFNFRVSFPKSMIGKAEDAWYSKHALNIERLLLEETMYLKTPYAELDFSSSSFFSNKNALGSVDLKNNFKYGNSEFSLFAEVMVRIEGRDKNLYELNGYFWKK